METIHHVNIAIHVIAGTAGLLAGLAAAFANKSGRRHVLFGRWFMWSMVVLIITALTGIFVFNRNSFLLVITLLSGYNCFSGIRAMRLNGRRPRALDQVIPVVVLVAALYYVYYIRSTAFYWSPVIIYSTIGALFTITMYDLFKWALPGNTRKKAVLYEHVYKMISALSGMASAFTGTVLSQYKPYSQFLPSVIGFTCIIVIFIRLSYKRSSFKRGPILHQAN